MILAHGREEGRGGREEEAGWWKKLIIYVVCVADTILPVSKCVVPFLTVILKKLWEPSYVKHPITIYLLKFVPMRGMERGNCGKFNYF